MSEATGLAIGQTWRLNRDFWFQVIDNENTRYWQLSDCGSDHNPIEEADDPGAEFREILAFVEMPRPYRPRVVFKRWFVAPTGYEFGSKVLKCIAKPAFMVWCNRATICAGTSNDQ